jgi:hypothetical protein
MACKLDPVEVRPLENDLSPIPASWRCAIVAFDVRRRLAPPVGRTLSVDGLPSCHTREHALA